MRLLIVDNIRRTNPWLSSLGALIAAGWYWAPELRGDEGRLYAWSMGAALLLGRQWILEPRPLWYLPVPRREVWRAWWVVHTVGVTLFLLLMKLPFAVVGSTREVLGISGLLLSTTYDFATTGIGASLAVLSARPRPVRAPLRMAWSAVQAMSVVGATAALPIAVYLPQLLGVQPPVHWSALSAPAWTVLAAGLALTVATYFAPPGPPVLLDRLAQTAYARTPSQSRRRGIALTGLPRLLVQEYGFALAVGGSFVVVSTLFVLFMTDALKDSAGVTGIVRTDLQVLGGAPLDRPSDLGMLNLMLAYGVLMAVLSPRFVGMLRHLRVLPIGRTRLNALLVVWPAIIWLSAWVIVFVAHYAVLGSPPASRSILPFISLIGFSALVLSFSLRLSGAGKYAAFLAAMGILPLMLFMAGPSVVCAAIGLACLPAAAAINRIALSRNSTYKPGEGLYFPIPSTR
jgi:hypothetical protein